MRLDHLHIFCRNLEPAITFLTEALGGKIKARRLMGGKPGAEIAFDGLTLFVKEVRWRIHASRPVGQNLRI